MRRRMVRPKLVSNGETSGSSISLSSNRSKFKLVIICPDFNPGRLCSAQSDFNPQRCEPTNALPESQATAKAEPGAKRSGATGSTLKTLNGRAPAFCLVYGNPC